MIKSINWNEETLAAEAAAAEAAAAADLIFSLSSSALRSDRVNSTLLTLSSSCRTLDPSESGSFLHSKESSSIFEFNQSSLKPASSSAFTSLWALHSWAKDKLCGGLLSVSTMRSRFLYFVLTAWFSGSKSTENFGS